MQKLRFFFIGFGFFWIFLWSILGSLIGVKMNSMATHGTAIDFTATWQQKLLTQAHAHMNMMAITLILMASTWPFLKHSFSDALLKKTSLLHFFSLILFGFGLVAEAFLPTERGHVSFAVLITTCGAAGFMLSTAAWGSFFLYMSQKKHGT